MKDLKGLIKKDFLPLLSSYGFTQHKNNLIMNPVDDLIKGFCFDRHDSHLYVHLFVQPLFIPSKHQILSYGWRLKRAHSVSDMFLLNDEQIENTKSEIGRLMLNEKDVLLKTTTALDFYNIFLISDRKLLISKDNNDIRYQEALAYTESYINIEKTCALVTEFLHKWENDDRKNGTWMQEIMNNMLLLKKASASKENVRALFEGWKDFTKKNLNLPSGT